MNPGSNSDAMLLVEGADDWHVIQNLVSDCSSPQRERSSHDVGIVLARRKAVSVKCKWFVYR